MTADCFTHTGRIRSDRKPLIITYPLNGSETQSQNILYVNRKDLCLKREGFKKHMETETAALYIRND